MPSDQKGSDNYYTQVQDSIKSVFELTTRVDERVQLLMKKQEDLENKIDTQLDKQTDLIIRVRVLESKNGASMALDIEKIKAEIHSLELKMQETQSVTRSQEGRWKTILNFSLQLLWVVLAAYILYRLGIQAPAVP